MKKAAGRGTWKTPPSVIYAEPGSGPAPPAPSAAKPPSVFGTKAHLLGLGAKLPTPAPVPDTWPFAFPGEVPPPPPPPPPLSSSSPSPSAAAPAAPAPVAAPRNFGSPANAPKGRGRGRGRGRAEPAAASAAKPTPSNKTAELARLRQLAKLRREIQKSTTDNLELEMTELCEIKAYLSACSRGPMADAPAFGRIASQEEMQAAKREALEKAVGMVKASANSTRSNDSHYRELESQAAPEAHLAVSRGDALDKHIACLIGTRREARSLVPERRQMAVAWAAEQVRTTVQELAQDALPLVGLLSVLSVASDQAGLHDAMTGALNLSPAQLAALREEKDAVQADVARVVELENEVNALLLSPLWLQHSEQLVDKLRDSMSIQQMDMLLAMENADDVLSSVTM